MITSKTPLRISFFGGGTDMEEYFKSYGGAVISTTIDKYTYASISTQSYEHTKMGLSDSAIDDIFPPITNELPLIRNALKMLKLEKAYVRLNSDLPTRSGLGASSSLAVGILNSIHAIKQERISKTELANEAIYLERNLCGEVGGWQDQIAVAFGGFNKIIFDENGYEVIPLNVPKWKIDALNQHLLLFFTGITRSSSLILESTNYYTNSTIRTLHEMHQTVYEAEKTLLSSNEKFEDFGALLNETWMMKKKTGTKVTNNALDDIYALGISAGALGGKLLGAGGGGFILFLARPECHMMIRNALKDLLYVPFKFETEGAIRIIS